MHIAVDLDDVIADLISELLRVHARVTGRRLTRDEATAWDVFPPEVHQQMREGGYARLLPLPGAGEFLAWLNQRHRVSIVTYRNESCRDMTEAWLARHVGRAYDGVYFAGGIKLDICRKLEIDLIIDDSYNQIPVVTAELGVPGILMDTPMNRHIAESDLIRRAADLREARCLVEELT